MRLLAAGALREDFWSFLQLDRKERFLMKYPDDFENITVEEQKAVALFLCNNFSSDKETFNKNVFWSHIKVDEGIFLLDVLLSGGQGADWLLFGSPWQLEDGSETSNVRITSKVAAFSLVSYTPSLQDYGSAIIYNIGG